MHPFVKRVSITPDAIELVYWDDVDGKIPTDVEILQRLAPSMVSCSTSPPSVKGEGPADVTVTVTNSGDSCLHSD